MITYPERLTYLTDEENQVLDMLNKAAVMFDAITEAKPEFTIDATNFFRSIDYARDAVIMRGARRVDTENPFRKGQHKIGLIIGGKVQDSDSDVSKEDGAK